MSVSPSASGADLANCDTWPVRSPDAIQPFGYLLALGPDGAPTHWSANAAELTSEGGTLATPDALKIFTSPSRDALLESARADAGDGALPALRVSLARGGDMRATPHRQNGRLIVELEGLDEERAETLGQQQEAVAAFAQRLDALDDPLAVCVAAAGAVKSLTGYDRVMVYRFHEDFHGEVIAEERNADLESWLGLHYPASDIPAPARAVFAANKLRMIPDAGYAAVPIHAAPGEPSLDLTRSLLRSVAPIHIEYLRNMRVRASLTLSLRQGERLWGLVACHHYAGPKLASSSVRNACAILADYLGAAISLKAERETFRQRRARAAMVAALRAQLLEVTCPISGLVGATHDVMALVSDECSGAAVVSGTSVGTVGTTPSSERVHEIVAWIRSQGAHGVYATDRLGALLPMARDMAASASGLLAIVPSEPAAPAVLWFKPEAVQTVRWGGNPEKAMDTSEMRVHPRKSFESWAQTVRGTSTPWQQWELEVAESFLLTLTSDELRRRAKSEAGARAEAERADRTKQDFVGVISHDLRDPLSSMNLSLHLLKKLLSNEARERTSATLGSMERAIAQMTGLVKALLDLSALDAGRLKLERRAVDAAEVLRDCVDVLTPIARDKKINIEVKLPATPIAIQADRDHILQVCSNIIGNAIKYTPEGGNVEMRVSESRSKATFEVEDTGPGIADEHLPHVFDRFYRATATHARGVGLGLAISKGVVEAHGGAIGVRSRYGEGSTFWFSIPKG